MTTKLSKIPGPRLRDCPLGAWDALVGGRRALRAPETHLDAAMQWLCTAQDATGDDGLARMYHVRWGWGGSYPETTGYAIPTFFDYADHSGRSEFADRAIRMARWESDIQMDSGAVQGGVVTDTPTPAIFNTGQVLFGWCRAYEKAGEVRFRASAEQAAEYLCRAQDNDGAWRRELSDFCESAADSYAFNVRTAWALARAARVLNVADFERAALANAEYVLTLAHDNGWLEQNCLNRPEQPLLHTIAYSYQGLLEIAELCGHAPSMRLVETGSRSLLAQYRRFGRLHGRYERDWRPTVRWRCLSGEAQTAVVWFRLAACTGDETWRQAAEDVIGAVKRTQALGGRAELRGGIKGSQPITGAYGRLEYLNWAAKFFADAVLLELRVGGAGQYG